MAVLLAAISVPTAVTLFVGGFLGRPLLVDYPNNFFLFGRIMEVVIVSTASLVPASLYFLFRRDKLSRLRDAYYNEIVDLDPHIESTQQAKERYGPMFREIHGEPGIGTHFAGDAGPISITTLLISVAGTLIFFPPIGSSDLGEAVTQFSQAGSQQLLTYGFLGAYFFGLNMLFRRYVQSDLTSKAYSHVSVRFLITNILVWVLIGIGKLPSIDQSLDRDIKILLAFTVGVVPEAGTTLIAESLRRSLGLVVTPLRERQPLSDLQGITLYDQARLLDEGVENVEQLAHVDIVRLLLATRLGTARIIDLVDQSVLYLQVADGGTGSAAPLHLLRRFGIRTATDLEQAYEKARARGQADEEEFLNILGDGEPGVGPSAPPRIRVLLDVIGDQDSMPYLRKWRFTNSGSALTTSPSRVLPQTKP